MTVRRRSPEGRIRSWQFFRESSLLEALCQFCGERMGNHEAEHPHANNYGHNKCKRFVAPIYDQPRLPTAEEMYELLKQSDL